MNISVCALFIVLSLLLLWKYFQVEEQTNTTVVSIVKATSNSRKAFCKQGVYKIADGNFFA